MNVIPLQRPRRPETGIASVTQIHARPEPAPPTDFNQGTLALELDPQPGMPSTPELRLVTGGRVDLERWAARFVQAAVDAILGDRPLAQLVRCTSESVHRDLARRCATVNQASSPEQRRRRARAQVHSVRVFCPTPHAAEVAVHLRQGQRGRAVALRLEVIDDRWQCVALQFG